MNSIILWIVNTFVISKLNKLLKSEKADWTEKAIPIMSEVNVLIGDFLEKIKDREMTEQETEDFVNKLSESIEKLIKG